MIIIQFCDLRKERRRMYIEFLKNRGSKETLFFSYQNTIKKKKESKTYEKHKHNTIFYFF